MADEEAADILGQVERGEAPRVLLAWIPLMKGGSEDGIIAWWKRLAEDEPNAKRKTDLKLVLVFAELARCLEPWNKALEGFAVIRSVVVERWKDEARAEGRAEGRAELLHAVLKAKFDPLPGDLLAKLGEERSLGELMKWTVAAATADSLEQFRRAAGL